MGNQQVWSPNGLSKVVTSPFGFKQGCPLSPTLYCLYIAKVLHYIERFGGKGFGACINELEQIVAKFVKEESIDEVFIKNVIIMLLLYTNIIVLFGETFGDAQRHLESFVCLLS